MSQMSFLVSFLSIICSLIILLNRNEGCDKAWIYQFSQQILNVCMRVEKGDIVILVFFSHEEKGTRKKKYLYKFFLITIPELLWQQNRLLSRSSG